MSRVNWWFDLPTRSVISLNNKEFKPLSLEEIKEYPCKVICDSRAFSWLQLEGYSKEKDGNIKIGQATFKYTRGATKENTEGLGTQALKKMFELCPDFVKNHPTHDKKTFKALTEWVYPPRQENLKKFTFEQSEAVIEQIWKIDIKACHLNIMKDYPLPCGEPIHLQDPLTIEKALAEGKTGFVRFILTNPARIKNNQIPFIPNFKNQIKAKIKGKLLSHTRLYKTFKKQYKIIGKIKYTDFWIFAESKGAVDQFLDYCLELKKNPEPNLQKSGKMLANTFYGAVGKSQSKGYNYRAWTLAINHLAILQTYYLYRQFEPDKEKSVNSLAKA